MLWLYTSNQDINCAHEYNVEDLAFTGVVSFGYFAFYAGESFEVVVVTDDHVTVGRHLRVHFEHLRALRISVPEGRKRGFDTLTGTACLTNDI